MSHFPLESYLYETFGVQSSSRDFSNLTILKPIGLQTALDRYKFSEPLVETSADPKKKEKGMATQPEETIPATGISCKIRNILIL
jgi:hypothetical protein